MEVLKVLKIVRPPKRTIEIDGTEYTIKPFSFGDLTECVLEVSEVFSTYLGDDVSYSITNLINDEGSLLKFLAALPSDLIQKLMNIVYKYLGRAIPDFKEMDSFTIPQTWDIVKFIWSANEGLPEMVKTFTDRLIQRGKAIQEQERATDQS